MRNTLSSASMRPDIEPMHRRGQGLVDVLDRVLDKGLIVAGDIRVALAEVELLTIRIRLLVCSIDKAEEIGLDWWRHDPYLNPRAARAELPPRASAAEDLPTSREPVKRTKTSKSRSPATTKKSMKKKTRKSRGTKGGSRAR